MITLYSVEFCLNDIGVFNRSWRATEEECSVERQRLIDDEGCDPEREMNGEFGCIGDIEPIEIDPTPEGLLDFAANYAIGGDSY